jgi:hypothetical protein
MKQLAFSQLIDPSFDTLELVISRSNYTQDLSVQGIRLESNVPQLAGTSRDIDEFRNNRCKEPKFII